VKVRCIDNRPFLHEVDGRIRQESRPGQLISLTKGKVYDVVRIEQGWYRIVDDTGEDYLYPDSLFEIAPAGSTGAALLNALKDARSIDEHTLERLEQAQDSDEPPDDPRHD